MEKEANGDKSPSKISLFISNHPRLSFLLVAIIFSFLTVTFSNGLSSFIYQNFRQDYIVNDPEFFYLFANSMLQGKTPYIDLFDHKGLYIFYFHALGILIGDRIGLYFLEIVYFIPVYYCLLFIFKEMGACFKSSLLLICLFLVGFIAQFQGASDEEVELPFLVLPIYFYVRGFTRKDDKSLLIGTIFWGVMAGVCFNVRPSDAFFAIAPCIAYAVYRFKNKQGLILLRDAGLCILAFLIAVIPAYIVAYAGGYLQEMIDAVFASSFSYIGVTSDFDAYHVLLYSSIGIGLGLLIAALVYLRKRIDHDEWIAYLTCLIICGAEQLAVAEFFHYLIMAYPYVLIILLRLYQNFPKPEKKPVLRKSLFGVTTVAFLAMAIGFPCMYYAGGQYEEELVAIAYVEKYISQEERDSYTICIDCEAGTYNQLEITPQYKDFAMQGWHSLFDDELIDELKDYLYSGYCHFVILEDDDVTGAEYRAPIRELIIGEDAPFIKVDQEGVEESSLLDIYRFTGEFLEGSYEAK